MTYETLTSQEALRKLYDRPIDLVIKKQKSELDQYSEQFLKLSPFAILSSCNSKGSMDCSPRGDFPGFIEVIDKTTLAIPDRPGNNRLDTLSNIIENPNIGILVLIPGFSECLRINGRAGITIDSGLVEKLKYRDKRPRSVIVISIKEIYFHCAKAIIRSKLWDESEKIDRNIMPSLGRILMNQTDPSKSEEEIYKIEQQIEKRKNTTLY